MSNYNTEPVRATSLVGSNGQPIPMTKFDTKQEVKLPKGANESGKGVIVGYELGGKDNNPRLPVGWNYYVRLSKSTEAFVFSEKELIDANAN